MLRAFLSSFTIIMIGVGCAFFTNLILAKTLLASEYGVFSFVYSVSLLISIFSLFGFQNSVVRLIPSMQGNFYKIKKLIKFSHRFTLSLAILSGIAFFTVFYFFNLHEKYPMNSLVVGVIMIPFMVSMRLHASYMRGFEKGMASALYETSLREILFLIFIGIAFFTGYKIETGFNALLLLAASLIGATFISWVHAHLHLKDKNFNHDDKNYSSRDWIKISLPMTFIVFAQRLLRRSDLIILGLMVNPAFVGAYAIAAQFADVSSIGQKGVFAVFSARAAKFYADDSKAELKHLFQKMQIYGAVTTGGMSLAIGILAPYVMNYFGKDYSVGYEALIILLIGQFINVCCGPVGVLMIMTEYEKTAMKYTLMAAVGNILVNPIAIYYYGLNGAATITAIFLIARGILSYLFAKRHKLI